MKFRRLELTYHGIHKSFFLTDKTLIYSGDNSVGKSTILRLLFYGLGYSIPGTYKLKFREIEVKVFFVNKKGEYSTKRLDNYIELYSEGEYITSRSLTGDDDEWFAYVWGIDSIRVLRNVLGAMYMDQDKGWTLLNRGKVIGNIRFNIRDLLIGLSGNNDSLSEDLAILDEQKKTLKQTRQLLDIVQTSENMPIEEHDISSNDELNKQYKNLKLRKKVLQNNLKKTEHSIQEQDGLENYIDSLHIMINVDDTDIVVTKKNLLHFRNNIDFLKQKAAWIQSNIEVVVGQIAIIKKKLSEQAGNLFHNPDVVERTLGDIAKIPVDNVVLEARISELIDSINSLNKNIEQEFTDSNELISETRTWINFFAERLGISDVVKNKKYIFTRDLKSISGTVYYKVVFSFKMAYLKVIEKYTGIVLPIVLDSPSGREVTGRNISVIIGILNEYFVNNQIIIASINKYNLKNMKTIEIKKQIFNNE